MQNRWIAGVAAALVILIGGVFVVRMLQKPSSTESQVLWAGPIKLKYNPNLKTGVVAVLDGREITEQDLLSRSKLLEELITVEAKLLLDAIARKIGDKAPEGTRVEIFRPRPPGNFQAQLPGQPDVKVEFSPQRFDTHLAKINDNLFTWKDLSNNQVRYGELTEMQKTEILQLLKGVFLRQLLLYKAKDSGTDIEGLIRANIIKEDTPVTEEDIDRFAEENGLVPSPKDKSQRDRLKIIITDRRRTAAIDAYAKVQFADKVGEVSFLPVNYDVPLIESLALIEQKQGSSKEALIFAFGNLLCPSCAQMVSELKSLRQELKGKVRVGFVHSFSQGDWKSQLLAESSMCLAAQQPDYFWSFADQASREGETIDEAKIYDLVKVIGADLGNFRTCLLNQTYKKAVGDQLKYATDLGVSRIPTVIVGGRILGGKFSREDVVEVIRSH